MDAPTLFDVPVAPLPARSTDPATSKRSARDLPVRERQLECLLALRWLAVASDPAAIRDRLAESGMRRERNEVASRLSELERMGLVCRSGVKQGPRGRPVGLWRLTDAGVRVAKEAR